MLGMKQEGLAHVLGGDWSQKKISLLEGKETVDDDLLQEVAKALKVPVEAIKNFTPEAAYNVIGNTVHNHDNASGNALFMYQPTFNPIEKLIEALEENKRLYTQLLQEKDEKIALLQGLQVEKNNMGKQ